MNYMYYRCYIFPLAEHSWETESEIVKINNEISNWNTNYSYNSNRSELKFFLKSNSDLTDDFLKSLRNIYCKRFFIRYISSFKNRENTLKFRGSDAREENAKKAIRQFWNKLKKKKISVITKIGRISPSEKPLIKLPRSSLGNFRTNI